MKALGSIFCLLVMCGTVAEASLTSSPFPRARPVQMPRLLPVFGPPADAVRPRPRPDSRAVVVPVSAGATIAPSVGGITRSPFPRPRPSGGAATSTAQSKPTPVPTPVSLTNAGKVCGKRDIIGVEVSSIPPARKGCGISNPVKVTSVGGVALSTPATMDCDTAKTLNNWVEKGLKPSVGRLGGGVSSMTVVASYACRTRNSLPGAKISEHGRGKAVDIAAFNLKNGKSLSVLNDWGRGSSGKVLKKIHKSACGPFGTVLGPNSDKYHKDHFHFDTAKQGSGSYCR